MNEAVFKVIKDMAMMQIYIVGWSCSFGDRTSSREVPPTHSLTALNEHGPQNASPCLKNIRAYSCWPKLGFLPAGDDKEPTRLVPCLVDAQPHGKI